MVWAEEPCSVREEEAPPPRAGEPDWEEAPLSWDSDGSAPAARSGTEPDGDPLACFGRDLARMPPLSLREERRLVRRMQQGDQAARHRLIEANLRWVVGLAKRYAGRSLSLGDLVQEGALGLIHAVDKYDPRRGCRLCTYSTWWIRQAITRALAIQDTLIRPPVHQVVRFHHLQRATQVLQQRRGRTPTLEELSEALRWPVEQLREMGQWALDPVSLDQPVGEEEEETWGDLLADPQAASPAVWVEREDLRAQVAAALATLTPRERAVVRWRYGFEDGEAHPLEEIGQQLGLSRERVRQIERKVLQKLRGRFPEGA